MDAPAPSPDLATFLQAWKFELRLKSAMTSSAPVITKHTLMGTEISPAAFHGNIQALFNFASLPPEVRILVYEQIVNAGRTTFPMPPNLKPYAALILSCK